MVSMCYLPGFQGRRVQLPDVQKPDFLLADRCVLIGQQTLQRINPVRSIRHIGEKLCLKNRYQFPPIILSTSAVLKPVSSKPTRN